MQKRFKFFEPFHGVCGDRCLNYCAVSVDATVRILRFGRNLRDALCRFDRRDLKINGIICFINYAHVCDSIVVSQECFAKNDAVRSF